jgi:hypothetical protein
MENWPTKAELEAKKEELGTHKAARQFYGITKWRANQIRTQPLDIDVKTFDRARRLEHELKEARQTIRRLTDERVDDDYINDLVGRVEALRVNGERPEWILPAARKKSGKTLSYPHLFISDPHYGEVVDPSTIMGVNEYNAEIARKRIATTFRRAVHMAQDHLTGVYYEGILLALGGDMITGEIHEDLSTTNDRTTPESIFDMVNILEEGILFLADHFGRVHVVAVPGNHARTTRKPRTKGYSKNNFDWLIYLFLEKAFANDDRVTFQVSLGQDLPFEYGGHRYVLTHGDQFRGGSGISGMLSPLMLGQHRKNKLYTSISQPFDYLLVAHWHQLFWGKSLVVNGTIKGYDEYAMSKVFDFETPRQAFWCTDPRYGMTVQCPIFADRG